MRESFEWSGLGETGDEEDLEWGVRIEIPRPKDTEVGQACEVQSKGLMLFSELK